MHYSMNTTLRSKPRIRQKLTHQMTFRVPETLYTAVEEVAEIENRKPNEVARFLLERGIEIYMMDGKLYETHEPDYEKIRSKLNG